MKKIKENSKSGPKFSSSSLDLVSNSVSVAWTEFETRSQFFYVLCGFKNCKKLRPSLKLSPDSWDRVLRFVPAFCYYIAHPTPFSFIFIQPTISSKSSLLMLQEFPTENLFFDRSRADPYSPLSSHQHCKFFFYLDYYFLL
jgi:hypothetical protein